MSSAPRPGNLPDEHLRAAQFFRGSVSTKMVASPTALRSLTSVDLTELKESERSCIICYNEFGQETPEGVKEAPLRLPKCKHVFGDHCIKKWFEESDSCPYCRDKLPSEPRIQATSRAFANFLRMRQNSGGNGGRAAEQDAYLRAVTGGSESRQWGGRRSPPSDGSETRRRMRARHETRGSGSPSDGGHRHAALGSLAGPSGSGPHNRHSLPAISAMNPDGPLNNARASLSYLDQAPPSGLPMMHGHPGMYGPAFASPSGPALFGSPHTGGIPVPPGGRNMDDAPPASNPATPPFMPTGLPRHADPMYNPRPYLAPQMPDDARPEPPRGLQRSGQDW
jgi:hypothetical protein